MNLGSRIREARLEAGLSQRQLCGDIITRNMLSLIENGSAVPSLQTLEALAWRLQRPMGYFFGETDLTGSSPLEPSWQALEAGDPRKAGLILEHTVGGSQRERRELKNRILLAQAETAIREDRRPLARTLLKQLQGESEEQSRKKLLLLHEAGENPGRLLKQLPSLDRELMLRAEALLPKDPDRAGALLDGAENHLDPRWAMLRGRVYLARKEYEKALPLLKQAEPMDPMEAAKYLEICCRELEDYKQAYYYASMRLHN